MKIHLPRKGILILDALLIASVLAIAAYAAWEQHSTTNVPDNQVTTGGVLTMPLTTSPTSAIWPHLTPAQPGAYTQGLLTITNGSNAGNVSLTTTFVGDAGLTAGTVARIVMVSGAQTDCRIADPYINADGTAAALAGTESNIYFGPLDVAAFGSSAEGAQAGDQPFAASQVRRYCFAVRLPTSAPITLANKTTNATFVLDGDPN